MMKRFLLAATIALGAIAVVHPAAAQIAAALGKPLPSPDMEAGSVSVRVIAGSPANPVENTEVTLTVNGTPRVARTDSAGRAFFKDLPAGATVQAKVKDEDGKEITSDSFPLPSDGGVRLMLSTKPFNPGGGGGAPFAPFAGGMPEPRQMSGQPRPEQADSPGTYTVRLTYDDFKDPNPPVGVPVTMVGYHADNTVDVRVVKTDKNGRAQFKGLDRSGATAYFAMAQLTRGTKIDRLYAQDVTMGPEVGVRLVLSSAKRTSDEPQIDDLGRIEKQDPAAPAGKVLVTLQAAPELTQVSLIDAATKQVIASGMPKIAPPDPGEVTPFARFETKADVPAGSLDFQVHGGAGSQDQPLAGIAVKVAPASNPSDAIEAKTADNGTVRIAMKPAKDLVAIVTINGKQLVSKPFDLTQSGGKLTVEAHWPAQGKPEITFDVAPTPGQVLYAETHVQIPQHGKVVDHMYRTLPFQQVPGLGTHLSLYIFPRVMFTFSLSSQIDDQYLIVGGRFEVINNSWAPYVGGPDGLLVPLPKGFVSAKVNQDDQGDVAVADGEGFRVVRPIPPGGRQFHGQFALPARRGKVRWDLDLPFGAFQSGMQIMKTPGMDVQLPPGVNGQEMTATEGTFFVLPQITIMPKQSMVMTITGLPSDPAWKLWVPRIVGVLVIGMMLGGLGFALRRKGAAQPADLAREARRQKLLDELVELERGGKHEKRREAVLAELEKLWE